MRLLTFAVVLALASLVPVTAATAAGTGELSGTVTSAVTGGPLAGAYVAVYATSGETWVGSASSDHNGAFQVGNLPPGSYDVEFSAGGYLAQYYNGQATLAASDPVSVAAGANTTGVDATMQVSGAIGGHVTDVGTGGPAGGVQVVAYDSSNQVVAQTTADAGGAYTLTGLVTGSYDVEFKPVGSQPYLAQYYSGTVTLSSATAVSVTDGQTSGGIDAAMSTGSGIEGTVTSGGQPAAGVDVTVFGSSGSAAGYGSTDAAGAYMVTGLTPGTYTVEFLPPTSSGVNAAPQYYDGKTTATSADPVTVADGDFATANADLSTGGQITGAVTDASTHAGLSSVEVYAYSSSGGYSGYGYTDANGDYTISSLATGTYQVSFYPYDNSHVGSGQSGVAVMAGTVTSGINTALATGGTITGTLTDAIGGHAVSGVEVEAIASGGGSSGYEVSGSDGTYRIGALAAGSYTVEFVPYTSAYSAYSTQYYNGATSLSSATPVSVSLGRTTSGIDGTLSGGGSVSGTVDGGSSSSLLSGVSVSLYSTSYQYYGTATTDASGGFFFGGLPAGSYIAYFNSPNSGYMSEYYGGTTNESSATSFTVTAGQATTGISATLPAYGSVSGTVTDASTQAGAPGITVAVLSSYGWQIASAVTGTGGAYTVVGVPSGTYTVQFAPIGTGSDYLPTNRTGVSVTNGATTSAIDEALPAGGTVTGTVTDGTSGTGLAGVTVTLYSLYQQYLISTTTGAGGTYSLPGLPTGTYEVGFSYGSYVSTYYGGSQSLGSATHISVIAGQTTGSVSQALPRAGQIAGRVTDAVTGTAIANVQVQIYDSSGSVIASTQTGTTGGYSVTGVLPGTYTASFTPGDSTSTLMSQWYGGATTSAGATSFAVTADQTTRGIDASLDRGGIVSGTVTAATSGADLAGITVTVYNNGTSLGSTTTRQDGTYAVGGIPTGSYTVGFALPAGGTVNYLPQYYDNAASASSATSVAVIAGQTTTGIDAALQSGGQVTGVVTDAATGKPVQNSSVELLTGSYYFYASTLTDGNGDYTFSGLPSGSYQVAFSIGDGDYLAQNYDGQNGYRSYTNVTVAQGSTTAGIDAALAVPAEIQGTVTDSVTGSPVSGVTVSTTGPNGTIQATTGSDGTYTLTGLYSGSYTVYFKPPSGANYLSQYYNGAATSSGATPVSVGDGADVTGISASLQTGGQISGTVTSQTTGAVISGLWVYVFDSSGNSAGSAQTGADGTYTVSNLPTGSYEVEFYGTGSYILQYYDGQSSYANANPVSVTAGQVTTGVNAAMLSNGAISGTVTDASTGSPIAGAYAYVYDSSGYYMTSAATNSSGLYTTPGLPAGSYAVKFSAVGYAPFTYSGTVSVSIGTTTSGISAALTPDGAISGTVTDAAGQTDLASVGVTAYDSSGSYVTSTSTASDGSYALENMVPGTYELEFTPSSGQNYLLQYYHGESTLASADPVTVTSGQTTTGIGAALASGGQVTGKVTDSATGQPIQYAEVELLNAFGGFVSDVSTAADGSFTLTGLPTGTYTLYFSASGHLGQYYNNESSLSSADQISVTAGNTTSAVNAALVPYGSIAGTVTDASTGHALQYVEVEAYDSSGQVVQSAPTSSTGAYTLSNLPPGTYALYFYDYSSVTGYVAQYYNDQSTLAAADGVTVNPGATTSAINAALVPEGAITGTVTDGNTHEAIPGIEVDVYDSTGTLVGLGTSSSTGQYTVGYLQPGTYRVGFYGQDSANQSVTQYYNQEATLAAADPVTVTAGATTSGIDSQLDSVPTNLSAPTITGTAAQGDTLTEHNGSWTFNPTSYAYQWERCGQSTCAAIPGATAQTYEPTNADVGDTIEVQETATNLAGTSAAVTSTATAAVVGEPPANTTPPSISGTAQQGRTLTEVPGVWTNQPSTIQIQWLQCASGICSPITGATGSTYVPTANDVGDTIEAQETASNDTGAGTPAVSSPTATVLIPAPVNTAVPTISGTAQEGQTLTEANGTWSGGAISYTFQWERCDTSGAHCQGIHGADASGYSPTAEDVGDTIEVWETAWNVGGTSKVAMSAPTAPVTLPPLAADAGEAAAGSVGVPVTLDGSGSIPASAITGYRWDFGDGTSGDGESVRHTYSATGRFTATLTVSEGSSTATSTVLVTVGPHASGVTIALQDPNGLPVAGADVVYMASDGSRINATADANGVAILTGMPDGADNVYAWAQGYQVATGTVTVSGGTGSGTVNLVPGQVASATLTSTRLTLSQIQALGIDTSDPNNQNVYQFQAALKFPPSYGGGGGGGGGGGSPDLCGYVNGNGQFVGSTGTCGGGSATCTNAMCFGRGWTAVPIMVNGEPMIEWLTIAGQVSVLKQFFAVDMVIQNLAGSPVELDNGSATLNLPDGLSLAPTATPQSATQSVGTIAAGQSAAVEWIVRGDTPGSYYFSADYHGTLQPFNQPITISAGLHDPLVVYGADALKLGVQADSGSMVVGRPYHVRLAITNTAPVPFYNVGLSTPDQATNFIFQPLQTFSSSVSTLNPGQTLYSPWFILVPALPSAGAFDPSGSYASFVGQQITPGTGITTVTPPTLYSLTSQSDVVGDVHLHWDPVPGATGYEVFSTPNLTTPFQDSPDNVLDSNGNAATELPAGATDAYEPEPAGSSNYFAVSAIVDGVPTLETPVITASPGVAPPSTGGGGGGGTSGGGSAGAGAAGGPGAPVPARGCVKPTIVLPGGIMLQASCFHGSGGVYTASGEVWADGLAIQSTGTFTVNVPSLTVSASGTVDVYAGPLDLYQARGGFSWTLSHRIAFPVPAGLTFKGLAIKGNASIGFSGTGADADLNASLGALGVTVSGAIDLQLTFASGLQVNSFHLALSSDVPIRSIVVKQATLSYKRTSHGDVWSGSVDVDLPGKLPELKGSLTITNGQVSQVGINLNQLNIPIADTPAVLQALGLSVTLRPAFSATGSIGISAGPKILGLDAAEIDGSLTASFGNPLVFSASGTVYVVGQKIESATLTVTDPGGVSFKGEMTREIFGVGIDGSISGAIQAHSFDAEGHVKLSAAVVSVEGDGLVNNVGVAACADAKVLWSQINIGGAIRWNGSAAWLQGSCGFTELARTLGARSSSAGGAQQTLSIPAGERQVNLIVKGQGAPPDVLLTQGNMQKLIAPDTEGSFGHAVYIAFGIPSLDQTDIALALPAKGALGVGPAPGAPRLASIGATKLLATPRVKSAIRALGGDRYRLSWRASAIQGQRLLFEDVDRYGQTQILATGRAGGSRTFIARDRGIGGTHHVIVLVEQAGLLRTELAGPSFKTARVHLGAPRVSISQRNGKAIVRWRGVRDATGYRVFIVASDGRSLFYYLASRAHSITLPAASWLHAKVQAVGSSGLGGFGQATARNRG
ncbi:MAG TPA: carboxypeptidase regulatory-like domain-containing protein [Solirubrobacteraceae bacterium]|jgi:5-hydroxyisourate hydrolase-like protein (transthyretin family)|nr:carboxypeptidase regulatory-like domain-containing protein [Solirubrobacteraceae bacterium]